MTKVQQEIRKKREYLRQSYGTGLIDAKTLARELGYKDYRSAQRWAKSVGLKTVRGIGHAGRYSLDDLAKVLIERSV